MLERTEAVWQGTQWTFQPRWKGYKEDSTMAMGPLRRKPEIASTPPPSPPPLTPPPQPTPAHLPTGPHPEPPFRPARFDQEALSIHHPFAHALERARGRRRTRASIIHTKCPPDVLWRPAQGRMRRCGVYILFGGTDWGWSVVSIELIQ
jgi:hypothetical protein